MTSPKNPLSNFILTTQQQNLLFAALNSNKANNNPSNSALALSPMSFDGSPAQGLSSYQASPDIDYEYDFGAPDSSFDFSFNDGAEPKMIGDIPGSPTNGNRSDSGDVESPDKRSHPDDDDDDEGSGAKRREGEDRVAKKPGRKPLTTEPSSKRKAQNRAAQRAFRERKEKHLKDLETKVEELEKASHAANHENDLLRAKVDKMTVELNEYKKRLSLGGSANRPTASGGVFGAPLTNGISDVNFQFEFPKFGFGAAPTNAAQTKKPQSASSASKQSSRDQLSPLEQPRNSTSPANPAGYGLDIPSKSDLASIADGLFSPPLTNQNIANASRHNSSDSHYSLGGVTSMSSPSASSHSNMGGPSSSCGTSPEPFTQSPMGFKPIDTLTTIGEEQSSHDGSTPDFDQFAGIDTSDMNWLPQNFQFDPQLFGDYREPQANILTNGLDDTFFNDAFDVDFTTPYNLPLTTAAAPKKDLLAEIDAAKEADEIGSNGQLLTCTKIWEKLQNCPKVQNGDFDLDGLCSDLQKKAKCSGSGAVVDEQDFKVVMKKYLGKSDDDFKKCSEEMLKV